MVFLLWMAAEHPYIALAIVGILTVLFVLLARTIVRALGRLFGRLGGKASAAPAPGATAAPGSAR